MTMNRSMIAILAAILTTPGVWAAEASKNRPSLENPVQIVDRRLAPKRVPDRGVAGKYQRDLTELKDRLKRLRYEHNALVHTLGEIRGLAAQEKAVETAKRLNVLIEGRTKEYQSQVKAMERGLERLRTVVQRMEDRQIVNRAGKKAAQFRLKGSDGQTVRLRDLAGKIVVLEWVNPECPIAKHYHAQEIPKQLAQKYQDQDVVWLGINSGQDQTSARNRAFVQAFGLDYPILEDSAGAIARAYGAKSTPHIFIIDAQGTIAYNGAVDDSTRSPRAKKRVTHFVEDALAALVAGKKVKVPFTMPVGTRIAFR